MVSYLAPGRFAAAELSYPHPGMTAGGQRPPGFREVRQRRRLGVGAAAFASASGALAHWRMHEQAGLHVAATTEHAAIGAVVLVTVRLAGVPFEAPCRVVYEIDDRAEDGTRRAGFAYGTLRGHPERGEEAFVVSLDADGAVWGEIVAWSRPGRWFTAVAGPAARLVQNRMTTRYLDALADFV
nr:DUF1990 domain-containing protein [Rhodococcus sp. HNM0569]